MLEIAWNFFFMLTKDNVCIQMSLETALILWFGSDIIYGLLSPPPLSSLLLCTNGSISSKLK